MDFPKDRMMTYEEVMAYFDASARNAERREEALERDIARREKALDREFARRQRKLAVEFAKRDEKLELELAKRRKENEEWHKKFKEDMAEIDRKLDNVGKQLGNMGENTGHYAEQFFQKAFGRSKTFAGMKFDTVISNLKVEKKESCEFDIVMINGDTVAIIEVKNRIHPDFVEELATKKLAQFRAFFPVYAKYRVYLGVAGLSFDDAVVEKANELGVVTVRQDGQAIEENAEGVKVY